MDVWTFFFMGPFTGVSRAYIENLFKMSLEKQSEIKRKMGASISQIMSQGMGRREENLIKLALQCGLDAKDKQSCRVNLADLMAWEYYEEVLAVYRHLGGILDKPPVNCGKWDITIGSNHIELDEEQHFNRYRLITLQSTVYDMMPDFPLENYRRYCNQYESNCVRKAGRGGYWSNSSTVGQFGPGSMPGELDGNGSPRWKQRAFYDYLKDIGTFIYGYRLSRISIWDEAYLDEMGTTVGQILNSNIDGRSVGIENIKGWRLKTS